MVPVPPVPFKSDDEGVAGLEGDVAVCDATLEDAGVCPRQTKVIRIVDFEGRDDLRTRSTAIPPIK